MQRRNHLSPYSGDQAVSRRYSGKSTNRIYLLDLPPLLSNLTHQLWLLLLGLFPGLHLLGLLLLGLLLQELLLQELLLPESLLPEPPRGELLLRELLLHELHLRNLLLHELHLQKLLLQELFMIGLRKLDAGQNQLYGTNIFQPSRSNRPIEVTWYDS